MISWLVRLFVIKPLAVLISWLWRPLPRRKNVVLRLRLSGRLVETMPRMLPFVPVQATRLQDVTALLRAAAEEPTVVGVRVDLGRVEAGLARVQEIRRALQAVRAAGKYVHVNMEGGGPREYLLACDADRISMVPMGTVDLVGMRGEVTYLGGLLASLGVHPDFEAVGDYKAFAERFVRSGPTAAAHENSESLLRDTWEQVILAVAAARGLTEERAEELLGSGPYRAEEAIELGLVDEALYPDEVRRSIKEQVGKHKTIGAAAYYGRHMRVENWRRRARPTPVVAVISASGQIVSGAGVSQGVITPRALARKLNAVRKDPSVAAVALRIDSPGGSADASDLIWRDIKRVAEAKPVVASMGDVAASGGYYMAMAAHQILAQPGTLTGSIGVVAGKINLAGLFEKVGLKQEEISLGENAGFYSTSRDFSASERSRLRTQMDEFYSTFVAKAADGREMEFDEIEQHARGRVWTGRQALDRGLVDGLGGLNDAVALASELAGYDGPLKATEVQMRYPPLWFLGQWSDLVRTWIAECRPEFSWILTREFRTGELLARTPFDIKFF